MAEGRQYLLTVVAYYQRAITEYRLDDILQDIALGLWRLDPSLADTDPETVSRGAHSDALGILRELRVCLVEAARSSPRRHRRISFGPAVAPDPPDVCRGSGR